MSKGWELQQKGTYLVGKGREWQRWQIRWGRGWSGESVGRSLVGGAQEEQRGGSFSSDRGSFQVYCLRARQVGRALGRWALGSENAPAHLRHPCRLSCVPKKERREEGGVRGSNRQLSVHCHSPVIIQPGVILICQLPGCDVCRLSRKKRCGTWIPYRLVQIHQ